MTSGRPGRASAIALLLVLPLLGAAAGSLVRRPPANPYRAVAVVVPPPKTPGALAPAVASRLLTRLVNLGLVVGGSPQASGGHTADGIRRNVRASVVDRQAVAITARGKSFEEAEALANFIASEASSLVGRIDARATGSNGIVLGDFEHGIDTWGAVSAFSLPPIALVVDHRNPRFGTSDLIVTCVRAPGCGIADDFSYVAVPSVVYKASAWVRAVGPPLKLSLVLGRGPHEFAASPPALVRSGWTRISVEWQPRTLGSASELDVQRVAGAGNTFALDGVSLHDPTIPARRPTLGALKPAVENALFASARAATIVPATAGPRAGAQTIEWAGGGLLAGVLLALGAVCAGRAAANCKPRSGLS